MQLAQRIEEELNTHPVNQSLNFTLDFKVLDFLTYPLDSSELDWEAGDVINTYTAVLENLERDPLSYEAQEEMARLLSMVFYRIKGKQKLSEIMEMIISPFLQVFRQILEVWSKEIFCKYILEGFYPDPLLMSKYKNLRYLLTNYSFNLDGEPIPIYDPIFKRYSDLLRGIEPELYNDELAYWTSVIFD